MATHTSDGSRDAGPYSFSSFMKLVNNNFGLIILSIAMLVIGFGVGTVSAENRMLKNGGSMAAAPAAGAAAPAAAAPEGQPLTDDLWAEIQKDPVLVIGNKNAKLTMVEFTDYQCPFCGRYYTDTHKAILDQYVKDGDLKIIIKDQPLPFHANALSAAQAVRCAVDQNKGLEMHDQLFQNQTLWSSLTGDALFAKYSEMAGAAGANGSTLVDCVKSEKHKAKAQADSQLGNKVGASGTPTFFIEKQPVVGAQPITEFQRVIDSKLQGS